MSAPTRERVLEGILVGEVGERRDTKRCQEILILVRCLWVKHRRERIGENGSAKDSGSSEERKREGVEKFLDPGFPERLERQLCSVFKHWRVPNNRHEEHPNISEQILLRSPSHGHGLVTPRLRQNKDDPNRRPRQTCVIREDENVP